MLLWRRTTVERSHELRSAGRTRTLCTGGGNHPNRGPHPARSGRDQGSCEYRRYGSNRDTPPITRKVAPLVIGTLALAYPFTGRWLVQNSPANRVPSHGTPAYSSAHAIDFVPVDTQRRSAPFSVASMFRPEPPDLFVGFRLPVLAPVTGRVVAVHDGDPDHDAFRGLPSVGYALTQRRRAADGWAGLAGNHVVIEVEQGAVVALCHLRRGSVSVTTGQTVSVGSPIGQCGNSGNSTEPHVHVQAMTHPDADRARAIPIEFPDGLPRNGQVVNA